MKKIYLLLMCACLAFLLTPTPAGARDQDNKADKEGKVGKEKPQRAKGGLKVNQEKEDEGGEDEAVDGDDFFKSLNLPPQRPKLDERFQETALKRYADLAEMANEANALIRERQLMANATDPKEIRKNKNDIEKIDKKLVKIKKAMLRRARALRKPLDARLAELEKEKADTERKVAEAERSGNDKKALKVSQEFSRKGHLLLSAQQSIDQINYFLFLEDRK